MVDFNWGCGLNYLRTYLSDFVIQNCIGVNFMYFVNFMWKTLCLSINLVRIGDQAILAETSVHTGLEHFFLQNPHVSSMIQQKRRTQVAPYE